MKIGYRSLRIGGFEFGFTYNQKLKQTTVWIGRRDPQVDRFRTDPNDLNSPKRWRPWASFKNHTP